MIATRLELLRRRKMDGIRSPRQIAAAVMGSCDFFSFIFDRLTTLSHMTGKYRILLLLQSWWLRVKMPVSWDGYGYPKLAVSVAIHAKKSPVNDGRRSLKNQRSDDAFTIATPRHTQRQKPKRLFRGFALKVPSRLAARLASPRRSNESISKC